MSRDQRTTPTLLLGLLIGAGVYFGGAWVAMTCLQILHESVPAIPPLGYGDVLAVAFLILVTGSLWHATNTTEGK